MSSSGGGLPLGSASSVCLVGGAVGIGPNNKKEGTYKKKQANV
jgi:hypothetical protein